jgi:TrmH family RNA methyltransferase
MMFTEITSSSNPKIKEAVKLRDGKYRRRSGRFLIDGVREIERAFRCGIKILDAFCNKETLERFSQNFGEESTGKISFHLVPNALLEKISFGNRNEGIVVVAEMLDGSMSLFETAIQPVPLLAVLERIEKPGNVGAIFRSADGSGVDGVILVDSVTDIYNPNTIRSSLGTIFRLPFVAMDSFSAMDWFRRQHIHCAVSRCDGAISYTDYDFRQPTAIILGNESSGLSEVWSGQDVTVISLPMCGVADSLNVSNAAAILFYEAYRQRTK